MLNLHPNVLSYDEYSTLKEYVEDMEDLLDLRKAKKKESKEPSLLLSEVKKKLGV